VDLRAKGGDLRETDGRYRHEEGEALWGTACARIEITAPRGRLAWTLPEPMPLAGCYALRFAYRKTAPTARVRVTFDLGEAEAFNVEEEGFSRDPGCTRVPFRERTGWVDVVLPFTTLLAALEPERRFVPGRKGVTRLRLEVAGDAGTVVRFDAVGLLRANANPQTADGRLVVGGRVPKPTSAWREVRMRCAGTQYRTKPAGNGYFFFEEKVCGGEIVEIWAVDASGRCHDPVFGRYREGHPVAELFRGFVAPYLRGLVLDVGLGPQPVPWYLEGYPKGLVAGIDPLAPATAHPFIFVQGVAEFLPWRDETFDVVVAATALDHLLVPAKAFEEIHRVLKPDGRFLVWTSFVEQAKPYDPYAGGVARVDDYHLFHYTRESFERDVGHWFSIEDAIDIEAKSSFYSLRRNAR